MKTAAHHIESLDVFRGATIAAMILVNNPGNWNAVFPQLLHANWNGCTAADVVFPFFVFIMGCAMPFAFERSRGRMSDVGFFARVFRRGLTLVALGLVLNAVVAAPHFAAIRVPGVLQRLGLAYIGAAFLVRYTSPRTQAAVAALLMLVHWALMTLVPFAGYPAGTLTPNHNLAGYIDRWVFGTHTLTASLDPEGLLARAADGGHGVAGQSGRSVAPTSGRPSAPLLRPCPRRCRRGLTWLCLVVRVADEQVSLVGIVRARDGGARRPDAFPLLLCGRCEGLEGLGAPTGLARRQSSRGVRAFRAHRSPHRAPDDQRSLGAHRAERSGCSGDMWRLSSAMPVQPGPPWYYAACFTAIWVLVAGLLYKRGTLLRA